MIKLIADLHTHTVASTHAYSTITENCRFADEHGIKLIAMTDHAMTMPDAPHCWHFHNLKILPRKIENVTVLKGAEANIIDYDGNIDLDEETLGYLEWVVGSYHKYTCKPSTVEEHTRGYLNIAKNPIIDVIGHPTTAMFEYDMEKCVKSFKEYEKIVEINESSILYKRGSKQNALELMKLCKKYEVYISIDSDAHFHELVGIAPNSIEMAESISFPSKLIINSDYDMLREFIKRKNPQLNI